jgi:hypothetical protein
LNGGANACILWVRNDSRQSCRLMNGFMVEFGLVCVGCGAGGDVIFTCSA